MRHVIPTSLFIAASLVSGISAAEETAFSSIVNDYEAMRQVLIDDSTEGIADHARSIASTAAMLAADFSPSAAAVSADNADAVRALLPEINDLAMKVATASDLDTIRNEVAEMTKPLVRWHGLIEGPRPVVAYCPMVKKAWLQPDEAIGNPYAPNMLRCGEVVQR